MKNYSKAILLLLSLLAISSCNGNGGDKSCNTGSNVQTHEHTPSTTYSKDENGHYHSCSCEQNIRFDFAPHTYVKNDDGFYVCSTCGYIKDSQKNEVLNVIKKSVENSLEYRGPLSVEFSNVSPTTKVTTSGTSDLSSGKYAVKEKKEEYDDSTKSWQTVITQDKIEIEEDKYILYSLNEEGKITATNSDKTFAEKNSANPWETVGDSLFKGQNSFCTILLRMNSYAELKENFPKIFALGAEGLGNIDVDIEAKDDLYYFILTANTWTQSKSGGIKLANLEGGYRFAFDKETLRSIDFGAKYTTEMIMSEKSLEGTENTMIKFDYKFNEDLYNSVTFEEKPAPTLTSDGEINVVFEGGFVYNNTVSKPIGEKVNAAGSAIGVNLYYDEALRKKVSDEEVFTVLPKTYYAEPIKDDTRAFVIYEREINYKAPKLFEKYLVEYTSRSVQFYQQHNNDTDYVIPSGFLPESNEVDNLNAKVTVNGVALDLSNPVIKITTGNLYVVKTVQDGVVVPFDD